jgi:hypothetical protein
MFPSRFIPQKKVLLLFDFVIAWRATLALSFRDGPKDQTRNLEIPGSLLRSAPE